MNMTEIPGGQDAMGGCTWGQIVQTAILLLFTLLTVMLRKHMTVRLYLRLGRFVKAARYDA